MEGENAPSRWQEGMIVLLQAGIDATGVPTPQHLCWYATGARGHNKASLTHGNAFPSPHTLQETAKVSVADIPNTIAVVARIIEADVALGARKARLLTRWRALDNRVHNTAQPLALLPRGQQAASKVVLRPHARRHGGDGHGRRLACLAAAHDPARR